MEVKVGDLYIRRSDRKIWRVKKIDNIMVVLGNLRLLKQASILDK